MEEREFSYNRKPINIKDDPFNGIVEIEGIKYSYELLLDFARTMPLNIPFKIVERSHGTLAMQRLD